MHWLMCAVSTVSPLLWQLHGPVAHCALQPVMWSLCVCRAMTEDMLKKAREDQIMHKEHFLAVQAQRDRTQFERILK